MCGRTSAPRTSRTTRCTTAATRASAAGHARVPWLLERIRARAAGAGGKRRSAVCTSGRRRGCSRWSSAHETEARSMSALVLPHGGTLVDRFVPVAEVAAFWERARSLPRLTLDVREQVDLELIVTGAASLFTGYLGQADYESVLSSLCLADGTVWPLPLTLAIVDEFLST